MPALSSITEAERILLGVISDLAAGRPRGFVPCDSVLSRIDHRIGLGPRYAYELLLDLARPWLVWAPLLEIGGVAADRAVPADEAEFTRCRLSPVGMAVLEQEPAECHLPLEIVNGTIYRGGTQPPLEPSHVLAALRELMRNPKATDERLLMIAGVPRFPSGCEASGDFDSLLLGQRILLSEVGQVRVSGVPVPQKEASLPVGRPRLVSGIVRSTPHILIESVPGRVNATSDVVDEIRAHIALGQREGDPRTSREGNLPIADVRDRTERGEVRIEISLRSGSDADAVRQQLQNLESLVRTTPAEFSLPLPDVMHAWVEQHGGEDGDRDLAQLERLIADARAGIAGGPDM